MGIDQGPTPQDGGGTIHVSDAIELTAATYERLRRMAAEYLRSERSGHTLQPTALLHEAFLRVLKQEDYAWQNEEHVIAFAARAMRRIRAPLTLGERFIGAQLTASAPHFSVPTEGLTKQGARNESES